ncbi:MAG: hypothetical protein HDS45_01670 [Bacteroides sp.]|nr:hypothetical protein [Bacteroides sp.]
MKKKIFYLRRMMSFFCLFWVMLPCLAGISQRVEFNLSDFEFQQQLDGSWFLINAKEKCLYGNPNNPCLPILQRSFALPFGTKVKDARIILGEEENIRNSIVLANNPQNITLNYQTLYGRNEEEYVGSYHEPNSFLNTSFWQGYPIANFHLCPFKYDENTGELLFIRNIIVEYDLDECHIPNFATSETEELKNELMGLVNNDEDVTSIMEMTPSLTESNTTHFDYLLITSTELYDSFLPLVKWKHKKGVSAYIISLYQIACAYEGRDLQEKIKHCIYDAYLSCGVKYVTIGGDDSVVPVRHCTDDLIPADLYYSCFDGDFNWNYNNNDFFGERADKVSRTSQVYLTRIPVRTEQQATDYINKLIAYERGFNTENWNESILMAGVRLEVDKNFSYGETEAHADIIYNQSIAPFWDGKRFKLFDTNTDFPGGRNYEVYPENIHTQFSKSPMFISMSTHGGYYCWETEGCRPGNNYYYTYDRDRASELNAENYSILTTIACDTNMFDEEFSSSANNDPCLSESFLRNKNSGIVAYYGSSRSGYSTTSLTTLGSSDIYEDAFYQGVFGPLPENKNFGRIVAYSKAKANCSLYLDYALNPMGDSEMPIYSHRLKEFNNLTFEYDKEELIIDPSEPGCLISITTDDISVNPESFKNNLKIKGDLLPKHFNLSITKYGFKPMVFNFTECPHSWDVYYEVALKEGYRQEYMGKLWKDGYDAEDGGPGIKDKTNLQSVEYNNEFLHIELSGSLKESSSYQVYIQNIFGTETLRVTLSQSQSDIYVGDLPKGLYTVVLVKDGEEIDCSKCCFN